MNSAADSIPKRLNSTLISDYYQLTKPRITFAVVITMWVGFMLGTFGSFDFLLMFHATLGTWLIASGTAAYNQFMERNLDGLMKRTEKRPLPAKRIPAKNSRIFSLSLIFLGSVYLISIVNLAAGATSLATTIIYLGAYTPMKRISYTNVFVGAIPGALPPVGGWAAAGGSLLEPGIWLVFAIMFLWQVPHVMAIAWFCKDDYGHAGFKMLPKNDEEGRVVSFWVFVCTLALFPVSYYLFELDTAGITFLIGSMLLAIMYFYYGILFIRNRSREQAKKLMFAAIAYLPFISLLFFIDRLVS